MTPQDPTRAAEAYADKDYERKVGSYPNRAWVNMRDAYLAGDANGYARGLREAAEVAEQKSAALNEQLASLKIGINLFVIRDAIRAMLEGGRDGR